MWRLLDAGAMHAMLSSERVLEDVGGGIEGEDAAVSSKSSATARDEVDGWQLSLARAIRMFASNDIAKQMFRDANGFDVLMQLAATNEPEVQEEVAWAIGVLASDPESETYLAGIGAIEALHG